MGWFKVGEMELVGLDLIIKVMEKARLIKERLKIAQSCQKSYFNIRKKNLEFNVDDWVYLKVSSMKGVAHFGYLSHSLYSFKNRFFFRKN